MNTSVYMVCCGLIIMHFIRVKAFWNNTGMKLMDMSRTSVFPVQLVLCIFVYLGFTYVVLCICCHYIFYVTLCISIADMGTNSMCIWTCSNNTRQIFNTRWPTKSITTKHVWNIYPMLLFANSTMSCMRFTNTTLIPYNNKIYCSYACINFNWAPK
jgi:hypothetical protein